MEDTSQGLKKCWCKAYRFSLFWHFLSVLFVLCLIVNGLIYFEGYRTNRIVQISNLRDLKNVFGKFSPLPDHRTAEHSPVANPHNYSYILNEPRSCNNNTELVMVVITSLKNFNEREAVRQTWGAVGKNESSNVSVVFLVGRTSTGNLQSKLENESKIMHDIIQEDFIDSYRNLSIKSQALLKWVTNYCTSAKYVLKTDDDMYVNVPNLLDLLRRQTNKKFILGSLFVNARPEQSKNSKWYTPLKDFNEKVYPRYTSGTAYSMSIPAAIDLYKASLSIKLFWLEDIYITGLCARKAGITPKHGSGFHYEKMPNTGCAHKNLVTSHRNTIQDIYKIHKELHDPNLKCSK